MLLVDLHVKDLPLAARFMKMSWFSMDNVGHHYSVFDVAMVVRRSSSDCWRHGQRQFSVNFTYRTFVESTDGVMEVIEGVLFHERRC